MPTDITFSEVCKYIKNDDDSLIEATGDIVGAAIICSPLVLGPAALPLFGLLGVKNQMVTLGKKLFQKLTSKHGKDYLARMERMERAYGLICYTAFFDTLDKLLPDDLRNRINLQSQEEGRKLENNEIDELLTTLQGPLNEPLSFPHPTSSLEDLESQLTKLYQHMAKNFGEYVNKMSLFEELEEKESDNFVKLIKKLPKDAIKRFEGQYYELARKYEDFRIWIEIKEKRADQKTRSNHMKEYMSLARHSDEKMDIGFSKLQQTVLAMPDIFQEVKAKHVVEALRNRYEHIIEQPLIEKEEVPEGDGIRPVFPKISEAFIPQSYRVLRHTSKGKDIHLEKEETWEKLDAKCDLEAFLLRFLSSPYSIEAPLLILGHPGSGKSLLTKVLSAKLMSKTYTPIRIPLRDLKHPESEIPNLVEEQINKDISDDMGSWADFSRQFTDRPLLIILDGYDELLQASVVSQN